MLNPWVVVPTYNESQNIEALVKALFSLQVDKLTVLIVDDSSPDGTAKIVQKLQGSFPNLRLLVRPAKSGLGKAYQQGFIFAIERGADAIVQMDADFSHDPQDVPRLLTALAQSDLVIGSRYAHGISVINWPLRRLLLSTAANLYVRWVTGMPFKDSTGGFRAWRPSTIAAANVSTIKADGYGFQIVMAHRAWKAGQHILEIPIIFTERREGQSKMTKSIIVEALWLVWRLRFAGR